MTYGIIGVGAIAAAIVTGLCEHAADAPAIVLSPRNAGRAADLASRFPTVRVAQSNQDVIDGSSVLLLCLRPQEARSVLPGLSFREQQAIVSMMAGISIEALRELVAPAQSIARAIPLPAVAAREGATPIFPPTEAARALFARLGQPIEIAYEAAFEATSASTATIAAHCLPGRHLPLAHCSGRYAVGGTPSGRCHVRRTGGTASRSRAGLWHRCARPCDARRDQ